MRLKRCLLHGFVDYFGQKTKSFDVLTGDQELEDRTATYGPEIDQSRHAKSVSQIRYIEFLSQALKFHYIEKYSKKVNTLKSKALK